jgi:MinD-like ATPase involved in chromosome partitioning or flagellar assembly
VAVIGIVRNVGTTYAAITLARALAQNANVVLVDLAFSAPNLSVVSTDPSAPGIAELTRGKASFGDIITRDQYSRVHLVAAGEVGNDVVALSSSPMLATVIEALGRSYEYVVIDAGSAGDVSPDRLAPLATRAMLVAADPSSSVTKAVRERLLRAGFREVAVIAGGAEAVAA